MKHRHILTSHPDKPSRFASAVVFLLVSSVHIAALVYIALHNSHPPIIESGGGNMSYFNIEIAGDGQAGDQLAAAAAAAAPPAPNTADPEAEPQAEAAPQEILKTTPVPVEQADYVQKEPEPIQPEPIKTQEVPKKTLVKKEKPKVKPKPQTNTSKKAETKKRAPHNATVTQEGSTSTAQTGILGAKGSHENSSGSGGSQAGSGHGGGAAGGSTGIGFAPGSGHCTKPDYPHESIVLSETGTARVRFMVEANGSVSAISLAKSSGSSRLDNAALKKAASCKFTPAKQAGKPVRKSVVVPYVFTLKR